MGMVPKQYHLYNGDVERVSLEHIHYLAESESDLIWHRAHSCRRDVKIYCHWTGGRYCQYWSGYHILIDYNAEQYMPNQISLANLTTATPGRATGGINIAVMCAVNAKCDQNKLGSYPPTIPQLEALYQVVTVLADTLNLELDNQHVMTHGEAADNEDGWKATENYGPHSTEECQDLEFLGTPESPVYRPYSPIYRGGNIIRLKAQWYRKTYKKQLWKYFYNARHRIIRY